MCVNRCEEFSIQVCELKKNLQKKIMMHFFDKKMLVYSFLTIHAVVEKHLLQYYNQRKQIIGSPIIKTSHGLILKTIPPFQER